MSYVSQFRQLFWETCSILVKIHSYEAKRTKYWLTVTMVKFAPVISSAAVARAQVNTQRTRPRTNDLTSNVPNGRVTLPSLYPAISLKSLHARPDNGDSGTNFDQALPQQQQAVFRDNHLLMLQNEDMTEMGQVFRESWTAMTTVVSR